MRHQTATKRKRARATALVQPATVTSLNPMRVRLHGATSDSKAMPVDPYSRTARPGDLVAVARLGSLLLVLGSPSPQIAADGTDQSATIDALLGYTGTAHLPYGKVPISAEVHVPNGAALQGFGGNINRPATTLLCTTADAGVRISGGGGACSGFLVDAAGLASTPMTRDGGDGGSQRILVDINTVSSAQDGFVCTQAQNDSLIQCGSYSAARRGLYITDGYGGANFDWFHAAQPGETNIYIDSTHSLGPYAVPSDITFRHGIAEYDEPGATNLMHIEGGYGITFDRTSFFAANAESGALIDITSGAFGGALGITIKDCLIQSTGGSTIASGSKGISVDANCLVILDGFIQFQNLDYALWVVSGPTNINLDGYPFGLKNINNKWGGPSGVDASLWIQNNQWAATRHLAAASTDVIESLAKDDFTGQWSYRTADGSQAFGDASGFSADVAVGRIGVAAWGLNSFNTAMGIGGWTTRPSFELPAGCQVIGVNYTTGNLDIATGNGIGAPVTWFHTALTAG